VDFASTPRVSLTLGVSCGSKSKECSDRVGLIGFINKAQGRFIFMLAFIYSL
jgi:hypothetical protein